MKIAKSTLYGAFALAAMFGSAQASSDAMGAHDATEISAMYPVDENHDGRADRMLELEQSDSLA